MRPTGIRCIVSLLSCSILLSCPAWPATDKSPPAGHEAGGQPPEKPLIRTYTVDKKVSEFPAVRDLSTPEAAYATIMRDFMATGASDAEWAQVSTWQSQDAKRKPVTPDFARNCLEAHLREVIVYKGRLASVIAEVKERDAVRYDRRTFFWQGGRWLNVGQDFAAATAEDARRAFARWCDSTYVSSMKAVGEPVEPRWHRPPIADPESYLKPYMEFLREYGRDPHAFLLEALAKYALVVMGEIHNRPAYWAFNRDLVRDPAFAETAGTIYLELPSNDQQDVDAFLVGDTCREELVVHMLRDMMDLGWPCRPTLEFFIAAWEVNRKLPSDKKLRIRLVDMQRPWEKIRQRADWRNYEVDRDLFMAQNILQDRQNNPDKRHEFFIVGMQHAMEGFCYADQTTPCRSAGWYLNEWLGDQLFTVFQHAPVMTNRGETSGRLALGLIDSALAQLQDRPVAFTLREGPFGKLPFDGMPDAGVYGTFCAGYDAYLYLIPLEDEKLAPLIDGFYSDEFAREVDRRARLMSGKSLFPDMNAPTGARVTRLRAQYWGQPRSWIPALGPENAWQYGDGWRTAMEQEQYRRVTRQALVAQLDRIYRGIREIDLKKGPEEAWAKVLEGTRYRTMTNAPGMHRWWWNVLKDHPLESVEYGELSRSKEGLPQIQAKTTLQGGIRFSKVFVFKYVALRQGWEVQYGLDLHLDPQWKGLPKAKKGTSP